MTASGADHIRKAVRADAMKRKTAGRRCGRERKETKYAAAIPRRWKTKTRTGSAK
jgi:hypothetical protein